MRSRSVFGFDIYVLISTLSLVVIGVLFIYSSGVTSSGEVFSREYLRQIIWASTGLVLLVTVSILDYNVVKEWTPYIYVVVFLLVASTLVIGRVVNGARAWIGIGELGVQPSEFMKLASVLLLALYLERVGSNIKTVRYLALALLICILPVGVIMLQPDLGTALVFFPIFLVMTYLAGAKLRHLFFLVLTGGLTILFSILPAWQTYIHGSQIPALMVFMRPHLLTYAMVGLGVVLAIAGLGLLVLKRRYFYWIAYFISIVMLSLVASLVVRAFLKDYQIMRLIVFLDPYVDPRGAGWNIIQSVTAVGSGGLSGKGFLQGTQSHYQFLPQQSTDFIFSILAEEWGFLGALLVFACFLVIFLRGLYIVGSAKDRFASFAGSGIIAMLFFHVVVNVGMAIGIMPITGIPLFFLSYGGSSLWTAMIGVGILMSIYQHRYRY